MHPVHPLATVNYSQGWMMSEGCKCRLWWVLGVFYLYLSLDIWLDLGKPAIPQNQEVLACINQSSLQVASYRLGSSRVSAKKSMEVEVSVRVKAVT